MDSSTMSGDEVVITGIAGKFPNSENFEIFQKKLLNRENFLSNHNPKWKPGNCQLPEKHGQIPHKGKFDPQAFGINTKAIKFMDPVMRLLIQSSYESVMDAGINPRSLKGKKIAVFTGADSGETEQLMEYNLPEISLVGNSKALFANRISFFLGLHGPSITINSSNTSSATALEKGYFAIKNGEVEGAIVGGGSAISYPYLSLHLSQLGLLSADSLTKSFDEAASGHGRSEAVVVLFLQKARDAKRIYAEIKNVRSWFGPTYDRLSVLYPTSDSQTELMKLTLKECGLSGKDISFVEADGIGIKEADIEEIKAIDQAYNDGREKPLLIGSVKSNVGSCFAANTLVSIVKVITMMESGYIPPNSHYERPSEQMSAIFEGRIKVVTEPTLWNGEYAAVHTTSMGGGVATVILKSFMKTQENDLQPSVNLPRLIMISASTEDTINTILEYMETKPFNAELFQLINEVFEVESVSHLYRGYTLLTPYEIVISKQREIQYISGLKREIWYIFSGMGSQWIGMGKALMDLPVFAKSVCKCDTVLRPYGIDIIHILTADDPKIFDSIINSFVGIITIQIGLVDLLNYLGIKPDFIIGHSVGELGCAYADGCLTAEQAVLNAMFRGLASVETEMPKGLMAAVGLGYKNVRPFCPPDIDVACHNSVDSSTISGPIESVKKLISTFHAKGIFSKEVQTSDIAYHSRYIAPAGPKLLKYLKNILPDSKVRSSKWISTSVPKEEWHSAKACLSSAEYYTNNLLCPVLFEEVTKMIPKNAITIEIAPHGLLQAILKRSLPATVTNLSLTKRHHKNNIRMFMDAVGKLYINSGVRAQISKLYSKINYPVSTGTPSLSSLMTWGSSEIRYNCDEKLYSFTQETTEKAYKINLNHGNWKYLKGNKVGNKIILPCSLYFKLVFSTIETFNELEKSIKFENFVIHENQYLDEHEVLELSVMVLPGGRNFEVTAKDGVLLCSGVFKIIDLSEQEQIVKPNSFSQSKDVLKMSEVYDELTLRGYQYSEPFKIISEINPKESSGFMVYQEDWHIFLEGMLQMYTFEYNIKTTQIPLKIRQVVIDLHSYKEGSRCFKEIPVTVIPLYNIVRSCGIELHDIQFAPLKQDLNTRSANVEEIKFTLNFDEDLISPMEISKLVEQLLVENNVKGSTIRLIEENINILDKSQKSWHTIFNESLARQIKFKIVSSSLLNIKYEDTALLVIFDIASLIKINLSHSLKAGDFLLAILSSLEKNELFKTTEMLDLGVVFKKRLLKDQLVLLFRKRRLLINTCIVDISDKDFALTDKIKGKINSPKLDRVVIVTRLQNFLSDKEIFNILQSEQIRSKVRYFEILDNEAPDLSLEDTFYRKQLELDLKFNILTPDRKWGFRRYDSFVTKRCSVKNSVAFQTRPGDLDSIDWIEQTWDNAEDRVKVEYSTINTFDVLLANGDMDPMTDKEYCKSKRMMKEKKAFGLEYSGTNSNGDRIMGLSGSGTLCSFTLPDSDLTWEVPNAWSLEEAATVPLAYATAYMALHVKAELRKKWSVLIYDGSCPIGQALITLALEEDLQVFSTYRTEKDRELLQLQYPSLNQDHLVCSDSSFEAKILSLTKGAKVDIVIYNSYNMNGFEFCWKCVKNIFGQFIIVGQLQKSFEKSIGMNKFLRSLFMYSIIPHNLINADLDTKQQLSVMIKNGLRSGIIKPIFSNLYSRGELNKAFVDSSRNLCYGKMLIKVQSPDSNIGSLVIPRFSSFKNKIYMISIDNWNDLFGIRLIDFLIEHGAKTILVVSVTGDSSKILYHYHLKFWEESEARVVFEDNLNLLEQQNVNILLNEALGLNPIDAIFDIQRMSPFSRNSLHSKYLITKNLFQESKKVCRDLSHFIVFAYQSEDNDDFNTFLFKESNLMTVSEEMAKEGLQLRLILWGSIKEIAQLQSSSETESSLLTIPQCMQELDTLIALPCLHVAVSNNVNSTIDRKATFPEEKSEKQLFEEYILNRSRDSFTN